MSDTLSIASKSQKVKTKTATANFIYGPKNIDISQYDPIIANNIESAKWLLHCTFTGHVYRNYKYDEFVGLHSKLLEKVMGAPNVKKVRDALENAGLLDVEHSWIPGERCMGYRLGPVLTAADSQGKQIHKWERQYIKGTKFAKRVIAFKKEMTTRPKPDCPLTNWLCNWCDQVKFTDDYQIVLNSILEDKPIAQYQIESIQQGMMHYSVCPYGRFHSPFSSLATEMRGCLHINGDRLHDNDIVCSQPRELINMIWEQIQFGTNCRNYKDKYFDLLMLSSEAKKKENSYSPSPPPNVLYFCNREKLIEELLDLSRSIDDGTFYQRYQDASNGQLTNKGQTKEHVFHGMYGRDSKHMDIWQKLWPEITKYILGLKRDKGYKWSSHELQRRESKTMIWTACRYLMDNFPKTPVVTVHDSIMTTKPHLFTVQQVIKQASAHNHFPPKIRTTINGQ